MKIEGEWNIYWKLPPTTLASFLFYQSIDVNQCYNDESSYSLVSPTTREKEFSSLCMGDVSPAGLDRFGGWGSLVLPWHEHVWGQLYVLVIFGQGEKGVAARVALRQGQSHVCILCLRRTRHIYRYIPTHRCSVYMYTLMPTEFQKTACNQYYIYIHQYICVG